MRLLSAFLALTLLTSIASADANAPHRRIGTLTKVGIGLFGAGYGAALVGGISTMGWDRYEQVHYRDAYGPEYYTAGGLLLVPIAGPFASAYALRDNATWAYSWAIADGVLQLGGLTVLVVGLVKDAHDRGYREGRGASLDLVHDKRVTLTPIVSPTSLGLSGTF